MPNEFDFSELSNPPSRLRWREVQEGPIGRRVTKSRPIVEYEMYPHLWRQRTQREVEDNDEFWDVRLRRVDPELWARLGETR